MSHDFEPVVGYWYRHLDKGQTFAVVAFDESQAAVEVQHYDGDVEEIDLDSWYEMEIEPTIAPKDWIGPLDDIEPDDLGYTDFAVDEKMAGEGSDEYSERPEEWSNEPEAREAAARDSEDPDVPEESIEYGVAPDRADH
ncbi:MAG: hypothetical protein J5I81_02545 [Nitrococcus mobilis]|nr:hypothetical protein [Nitrococcus mobilis]